MERLESTEQALPPAPPAVNLPMEEHQPLPAPPPEVQELSDKLEAAADLNSNATVPQVSVTQDQQLEGSSPAGSEKKGFSGIFNESLKPSNNEMAAAVSVSELDKEVRRHFLHTNIGKNSCTSHVDSIENKLQFLHRYFLLVNSEHKH